MARRAHRAPSSPLVLNSPAAPRRPPSTLPASRGPDTSWRHRLYLRKRRPSGGSYSSLSESAGDLPSGGLVNGSAVVDCACSHFAVTGDDGREPVLLLEAVAAGPPPLRNAATAARRGSSSSESLALRTLLRASMHLNASVTVYSADGHLVVQNRLSEALFGPAHTLADWWPARSSAAATMDTVRLAGFRGELLVPTRTGEAWHWVDVALWTDADGAANAGHGRGDGAIIVLQIPIDSIDTIRVLRVAKVRGRPPRQAHTHTHTHTHGSKARRPLAAPFRFGRRFNAMVRYLQWPPPPPLRLPPGPSGGCQQRQIPLSCHGQPRDQDATPRPPWIRRTPSRDSLERGAGTQDAGAPSVRLGQAEGSRPEPPKLWS